MLAVRSGLCRKLAIAGVGILVGAGLTAVTGVTPAAATPAPPVRCAPEQADEPAARRMVGVCGRRVEILSERTEYSQEFLNVDGSRTFEETVEPARVRSGTSWVPVDTTLRRTTDGVSPQATVLPMTLSAGGDRLMGQLRSGSRMLSVSWPQTLPVPVLMGSTAVYRDVLPDVDLQVTAQATGFAEVLVVRNRAAAANPKLASLRFGLSAKGVRVGAAAGGGLAARDAKGAAVFTAPAPLMWDSSEPAPSELDPGRPAGTRKPAAREPAKARPAGADRVRQAVMPVKVDATAVTITPNRAMLSDPRTQFPVYIDPSVTGSVVNNEWTSVWSKHPTSSFWKNSTALTDAKTYGAAGAGRTQDCDGCADHVIRSLFRMDTSKVKSTQIISAQFRIEQKHSWTCSPATNAKLWLTGGFTSATTWNNQPTWNSAYTAQTLGNRKNGAIHGCLGPGPIEFNVKSIIALSAQKGWASTSLGLRAVDEGTRNQWKRFDPETAKLAITYNRAPNAAADRKSDGKACVVGAGRPYVLWTNPTLAAKQSDPDTDQQNLTTDFYWWPAGGSRSESNKVSNANGNGNVVAKQIPTGRLTDGGTYVWQARTSDGALSTWSGTCEFTVDATPPPPPASVTSSNYSNTAPSGGVGLPGTFAIAPPTVRPWEIVSYAWTLDSGVQLAAQTVPGRSTDHGGSVTLAPKHDGINTLRVWSMDRAGRYSLTAATYTFTVRAGAGPAAEWTFDEADGDATDTGQHGNTVTLGAGASRTTGRGGVGSALTLTGGSTSSAATASAVTYPHPDTGVKTAVRTDSTFTVSARVKLATTTGVTGQRTVIAASGSRTSAYTLGFSGADNKWRFAMAGSDADNATTYQVLSNAAPTAGKWTYLAGVYDSATRKLTLYVNGVAQTATATLTGGFNATGAVTLGKRKWNGADDGLLNGAVDDVRVYSFAETAAKLAVLAAPLPPAITLPAGPDALAGGKLSVKLDAGGDTNVTKFRYSLDGTGLGSIATPSTAGGAATVSVDVGTLTGDRPVYAVADDGLRTGPQAQAQFTVSSATSLTGTVLDTITWLPVAGAVVKLWPGGYTTTSDADGAYALANLPKGFYTVAATSGGRCGVADSREKEIDGQGLGLDLYLLRTADNVGHTCTEHTAGFTNGGAVLPLTGDDAVTSVAMPFAFPFYGGAYRSLWIDTNGLLSFDDPHGSHPRAAGGPLISEAEPNGIIAPYWDDLVVDSSAVVRAGVVGSGATQQFLVDWRNVYRKGDTSHRISLQVLLSPDGTIAFDYDGLSTAALQGSTAVVGMEAPEGDDGFAYSTDEPALNSGTGIVFTRPDVSGSFETHNLSGTLTDAAGAPVAGAEVSLDPGGLTATTTSTGVYSFYGVVADSYTVGAEQGGRCAKVAESRVDLDADTVQDLRLVPDFGEMGYACVVGASGYLAASTVLPVTSDGATAPVALPFPMPFHGVTVDEVEVSEDGWIGVDHGYLDPFYQNLTVDPAASVRTQVVGTAPNRSVAIEWRNVLIVGGADRITFEVFLHEDGRISYHYGALSTPAQRGEHAIIGLESPDGQMSNVYFFDDPLASNSSITYTPAPPGVISGSLTEAGTGEPIAGGTIVLTPGNRSVLTEPDGSYQFAGVPVGAYRLTIAPAGDECPGQYASVVVYRAAGDADADLTLTPSADQYYNCTDANEAFTPGDTVQPWTGDDMWKATAPFPVKLYGESSTTVWISSKGFASFTPEGGSMSYAEPIPSDYADSSPSSAVYPFWDDWVVDDQAAMLTKISGTAPNRQWTVEWRNVAQAGNDSERVTFEVIFGENGAITFAYDGIDPADLIERGWSAGVGLESVGEIAGFQYLFHSAQLSDGATVHFTPNVPDRNSIGGTVTCLGVPVAGATVVVTGKSATTGADGTYRITDVPTKSWPVVATVDGGACTGSSTSSGLVGKTPPVVDFDLAATEADSGYRIAEQQIPYVPLGDGSALFSGSNTSRAITLPFPVELYGRSYTSGWIQTDGDIEFLDAYLLPFKARWVLAGGRSVVLAAVRGTAPNRQYVVEWRDAQIAGDPTTAVTFQAILHEGGGFSFVYPSNDGSVFAAGGLAKIGMQNKDDISVLYYADRLAALRPGFGLRIDPSAP